MLNYRFQQKCIDLIEIRPQSAFRERTKKKSFKINLRTNNVILEPIPRAPLTHIKKKKYDKIKSVANQSFHQEDFLGLSAAKL